MDEADPEPGAIHPTLFYGLWPRFQSEDEEAEEEPATD